MRRAFATALASRTRGVFLKPPRPCVAWARAGASLTRPPLEALLRLAVHRVCIAQLLRPPRRRPSPPYYLHCQPDWRIPIFVLKTGPKSEPILVLEKTIFRARVGGSRVASGKCRILRCLQRTEEKGRNSARPLPGKPGAADSYRVATRRPRALVDRWFSCLVLTVV